MKKRSWRCKKSIFCGTTALAGNHILRHCSFWDWLNFEKEIMRMQKINFLWNCSSCWGLYLETFVSWMILYLKVSHHEKCLLMKTHKHRVLIFLRVCKSSESVSLRAAIITLFVDKWECSSTLMHGSSCFASVNMNEMDWLQLWCSVNWKSLTASVDFRQKIYSIDYSKIHHLSI